MARQVPADTVFHPVAPGVMFTARDLMTYQEAEKDESTSSLYIANSVHHTQGQHKTAMSMELMFEVNTGTGRQLVRIPATWIPIDITTQVDRKTLLATPEFRKFTRERKILIVKPAYAEKILETPEAQDEQAKIQAKSSSQKNDDYFDMLAKTHDGSVTMEPVADDITKRLKNRAHQHTGRPTGIVNKVNGDNNFSAQPVFQQAENPDIRSDIAAIATGQFSDATIIAIISAHQNVLSLEECNFIIKNVQSEGALDIAYKRLGDIAQSRN